MKRSVGLLLVALLLACACAALCAPEIPHAISDGSDLKQKQAFLKIDVNPGLWRAQAQALYLSTQLHRLSVQRRAAASDAERARLGQEIEDVQRRLNTAHWGILEWTTIQKRQQEIRQGRPFPGAEVTLL